MQKIKKIVFLRSFILLTLIFKSTLFSNSIIFMEAKKEKKVSILEDKKLSNDMPDITIIYDDNFQVPNTQEYNATMGQSPFILGPYHPTTQYMLGYYYCKISPQKDLILNKLSNKKQVMIITRTINGVVKIVYLDSCNLKDNK